MLRIEEKDIGGARVVRTFTNGDRWMKRGDTLTREEILAFPLANRVALVDNHNIEIYPLAPSAQPAEPAEKFMIGVSKDKFNIIEGRLLNPQPLPREEADALLRA